MALPIPGLVVAYGVLVAAGGAYGWHATGSVPSLAMGGGLGVATVACGLGMRKGSRIARTLALVSIGAIVAVMGWRFARTGKPVPALPVVALGLPLLVLLARKGGGAPAAGEARPG